MSSPILYPRRTPVVPLLGEDGKILPEFLPESTQQIAWDGITNKPETLVNLSQVTAFRGNPNSGLVEVKNATTAKWHPVFADGADGSAQLATDPTGTS